MGERRQPHIVLYVRSCISNLHAILLFRFEALQRSTVIHQQPLLCPLSLEASAAEEMVIEEHMSVFEQNGFRIRVDSEGMPGKRVFLLAVPFSRGVQFGRGDVMELASMINEGGGPCSENKLVALNAPLSADSSQTLRSDELSPHHTLQR